MALKTKAIDTSSTTPAEFLSGSGKPVEIPAGQPSPETPRITIPEPGTVTNSMPEQAATPPPVTESAPAPDQETKPVAEQPTTDPFILIHKWEGGKLVIPATENTPQTERVSTIRTLRGMNVNGGIVLRLSALHMGAQLVESICFVPNSYVKDGELLSKP